MAVVKMGEEGFSPRWVNTTRWVNAREIEILQRAAAGIEQQLAAILTLDLRVEMPARSGVNLETVDPRQNHAQTGCIGGTRGERGSAITSPGAVSSALPPSMLPCRNGD